MRLLLAVSRPAVFNFSTDAADTALLLFAEPFSSSRYSDSKLLTDVAVFNYKNNASLNFQDFSFAVLIIIKYEHFQMVFLVSNLRQYHLQWKNLEHYYS